MVLKELLQLDAVTPLVLLGMDGLEGVQDVECSDVELVNAQDDGVAADDEGQVAEVLNALGDADWQLLLQVLSAVLFAQGSGGS